MARSRSPRRSVPVAEQAGVALLAFLTARGLTKSAAAHALGVTESWLNARVQGRVNVTAGSMDRLADALGAEWTLSLKAKE